MNRPRTILAAASLLLCVATLGLWVRSYFRADYAGYDFGMRQGGSDIRGFTSDNGRLWIGRERADIGAGDGGKTGFYWNTTPRDRSADGLARWAVRLDWSDEYGVLTRGLNLPHAALAALLAIPPLLWLARARRLRRRSTRGQCIACGYDLRATPERCPECGATPGGPR